MSTYITAVSVAKDGSEAKVKEAFRSMVEPTLASDPGCVTNALNRGQDDPRTFVFMKEWEGREQLEAHLERPHITEGLAAFDEPLESRNIVFLDRLAGGGA